MDVSYFSMKEDTFTFQWVTWRSSARVSIDFGEKNNLIQVIDVSEDGLAGERNRRSQAIPELCNQDLRPGDIIEIVNQRTDHGEIQQGLRSALNIHVKIVRRE